MNKFIYRKTRPKIINTKYTLIEFEDDSEICEYTPKQKFVSPRPFTKFENISCLNFHSETINNLDNIKKNKNFYKNYDSKLKKQGSKLKCQSNNNNYTPIIINGYDNPNCVIKEIRKKFVQKNPFDFYKKK